jgi:hypothetical protein
MNSGPYSAPRSLVDDPPEAARGPRPRSVTIALALQWLAIGANVALWSWMMHYAGIGDFQWMLVGRVIGLIGAAVLCVKIGHGANWARIVLLLLFLWDVGSGLPSYKLILVVAGSIEKALMLTQYGAVLVALILVFGPGRAWFRRR